MQRLDTWDAMQTRAARTPLMLAIGAFDGIHKGHQRLIRETLACARAAGGEAWLLTFDPHPSRVLRPDQAPPLLTSTPHKLHLLESLGLDGAITHPFSLALSQLTPDAFLEQLCGSLSGLHTLVVGENFRFGHRAEGDIHLLRQQAETYGYTVNVPDPVHWNGAPISSTRIRQAVERGDLESAKEMLDRPWSLWGTVTTGRQYGRTLGFPTANIRLQDEALPPTGVYAVYGIYNGTRHNGAAYLGIRPSSHGKQTKHLLEVHLFDVDIDLYDKTIEVFFIQPIRPDHRFDTPEALKDQIALDVQEARRIVS